MLLSERLVRKIACQSWMVLVALVAIPILWILYNPIQNISYFYFIGNTVIQYTFLINFYIVIPSFASGTVRRASTKKRPDFFRREVILKLRSNGICWNPMRPMKLGDVGGGVNKLVMDVRGC